MRVLTYDEIETLAKTDAEDALIECKLAIVADWENGALWGLRAKIEKTMCGKKDDSAKELKKLVERSTNLSI